MKYQKCVIETIKESDIYKWKLNLHICSRKPYLTYKCENLDVANIMQREIEIHEIKWTADKLKTMEIAITTYLKVKNLKGGDHDKTCDTFNQLTDCFVELCGELSKSVSKH